MRASLNMVANSKEITQFQVEQLFNQQEFCLNLFSLFDQAGQGFLVQEDWIAHLRNCCTGTGSVTLFTRPFFPAYFVFKIH